MREKILTALRRKSATTAELADILGFSYRRVAPCVRQLAQDGLVKSAPVKTGKRGRPATRYTAVR